MGDLLCCTIDHLATYDVGAQQSPGTSAQVEHGTRLLRPYAVMMIMVIMAGKHQIGGLVRYYDSDLASSLWL
jgi:hypothetical protein